MKKKVFLWHATLSYDYGTNRVSQKNLFQVFLNLKKKNGQCAISNLGMTSVLTYKSENNCFFELFGILGSFQAQEKLSFRR